jgi:hypothetical protein
VIVYLLLAVPLVSVAIATCESPSARSAPPEGPKARNKAPEPEKDKREKIAVSFPNFEEVPQSPIVTDRGIQVVLERTTFKSSEPVALYGTYEADGPLLMACHNEVDPCIVVLAIGRTTPGVWARAVLEKPNLSPMPMGPQTVPGPTFRETGHFNLELRSHLQLPDQPGRYWLFVSVGDYLTERLSFEIK